MACNGSDLCGLRLADDDDNEIKDKIVFFFNKGRYLLYFHAIISEQPKYKYEFNLF